MNFKHFTLFLLSFCLLFFISCTKTKNTPTGDQTVYASFIQIVASDSIPVVGKKVTFKPVYLNTVDQIDWQIDGISAAADTNASINGNILTYTFWDNKVHSFKVVGQVKASQVTATRSLTAVGDISGKTFNVVAFYDGTYDAAHINFVHEALAWFPERGKEYNFTFTSTNDWTNMNAAFLAKYQVVLFLDNYPQQDDQKAAFIKYMQNGGGWMGFHVSAFSTDANDWPWYFNTFLGNGVFETNTWGPTTANLKVEAPTHPAMKGIPATYTSAVSEWYSWSNDLRLNPDIKILASVDPSSFPLGSDPNQSWYSGYYPIMWTNKNFKMIYANFGHNAMNYTTNVGLSSTFASTDQNKFIINSLLWLGGRTQ